MKVALTIGGIPEFRGLKGHLVELPDDYEISDKTWFDLQSEVIKNLLAYQARGEVAPCFDGSDGDELYRAKMKELFRVKDAEGGRGTR